MISVFILRNVAYMEIFLCSHWRDLTLCVAKEMVGDESILWLILMLLLLFVVIMIVDFYNEGESYCWGCGAKAISWAIISCIRDCCSAIIAFCSSMNCLTEGSIGLGSEVVFSSEKEEAIRVCLLRPKDETLWRGIGGSEIIGVGVGGIGEVRDNWNYSNLAIRVSRSDIAFCIPVSMLRILSSFALVSSFLLGLWMESFVEEDFVLRSLLFPLVTLE